MKTNRDIIREAFNEIGLGPYAYSIQPEDYQTGLTRLAALLAGWASEGAYTGYAAGGIDDDSGLPLDAIRGAICALAVDLAPGFGKQPSRQTMTAAQAGRRVMLRRGASDIPTKAVASNDIPAGAGWKLRGQINFSESDNAITPDERSTT